MLFITDRLASFFEIPFNKEQKFLSAKSPDRWAEQVGIAGSWTKGPNSDTVMDRSTVRAICQDQTQDIFYAYVCVMAWGAQMPGKNAKSALAQFEEIKPLLLKIRSGTLSRAETYDLFCNDGRIKGLGPAYFTKLLFFFSPKLDAYIMDQWTAKSINYLTDLNLVAMEGDGVSSKNTGEDYNNYCEKVEALVVEAGKNGETLTGEEMELRLFSHGGRPPGAWRSIIKTAFDKTIESKKNPNKKVKNTQKQIHSDECKIGKTIAQEKEFRWKFNDDEGMLHIFRTISNRQRHDSFPVNELWDVLNELNNHYGKIGFPLANSVKKLPQGTEIPGLGSAHYARSSGKSDSVGRAQAASQLAAIYLEAGIVSRIEGSRVQLRLNENISKENLSEHLSRLYKSSK